MSARSHHHLYNSAVPARHWAVREVESENARLKGEAEQQKAQIVELQRRMEVEEEAYKAHRRTWVAEIQQYAYDVAELEEDTLALRATIGKNAVKIEELTFVREEESSEEEVVLWRRWTQDLRTCWNAIKRIGLAGSDMSVLKIAFDDATREMEKGGILGEIKMSPHYQAAMLALESFEGDD
jgi:hypothetical protein